MKGRAKYHLGSVGNIGALRVVASALFWSFELKAGSFVRPEGALGGDGAPACATNSSEQDDLVKAIWIPIREEGPGCEDTTLHGSL